MAPLGNAGLTNPQGLRQRGLCAAKELDRFLCSHGGDHRNGNPIKVQYPHSDALADENSAMAQKREVGLRLRHARKLRGMTQQQLAKAAGLAQVTISEVETGESKSFHGSNLIAVARVLRVSPEWLAKGIGPMEGTGTNLTPEAVSAANKLMQLDPEARAKVLDTVDLMIRYSLADRPAAQDDKVEEAYGRPGEPRRKRHS